jgi:hypothetical protein
MWWGIIVGAPDPEARAREPCWRADSTRASPPQCGLQAATISGFSLPPPAIRNWIQIRIYYRQESKSRSQTMGLKKSEESYCS